MITISRLRSIWPGLAVAACAALALAWGFWQPARVVRVLDFTSGDMLQDVMSVKVLDGQLESRRMTLQYPAWVRLSDPAKVRLTYDILPVGGISLPPAGLPEDYTVFVETSLDMPGLQVDPPFAAGQVLPTGRAVTFWWTIEAHQPGDVDGTAWLRLRFQSQDGETLESNPLAQVVVRPLLFQSRDGEMIESKTLAAPRLQVGVRRFLFLSGPAARGLGGLAAALGIIWIVWRLRYA